jgi:hypothetical protein
LNLLLHADMLLYLIPISEKPTLTMKYRILVLLLIVIISFSKSGFAQLNSVPIKQQADSLKLAFKTEGFAIVRETAMAMQSQFEIPIIAALTEGTWYRIIFIGDISSKLYEVRMFDWNEKQVVYQKKMWGDVDGNIINYDYIPRFSEYHMIKPVQINKTKKNVGGYMMLFKKIIAR